MMPQGSMFICCHDAPNSAPVLYWCIMQTLWECINPVGSPLCMNAALMSYSPVLHSLFQSKLLSIEDQIVPIENQLFLRMVRPDGQTEPGGGLYCRETLSLGVFWMSEISLEQSIQGWWKVRAVVTSPVSWYSGVSPQCTGSGSEGCSGCWLVYISNATKLVKTVQKRGKG